MTFPAQWAKLYQAGRGWGSKDVTDVRSLTCRTQLAVSAWSTYWESRAHIGTQSSTIDIYWVRERLNMFQVIFLLKGIFALTLKNFKLKSLKAYMLMSCKSNQSLLKFLFIKSQFYHLVSLEEDSVKSNFRMQKWFSNVSIISESLLNDSCSS